MAKPDQTTLKTISFIEIIYNNSHLQEIEDHPLERVGDFFLEAISKIGFWAKRHF